MHETISEIREHIEEGLTVVFEAPQRRGKTLCAVIMAVDAYNHGRTVFSNIQLGFPHVPLDFRDMQLVEDSPFRGGHIFIDELNFFFDSRRSMSKENREAAAFLLQSKKQGCNLTGTTHGLDYLDLRFRENYDYLVRPRVYPAYPDRPEFIKIEVWNGPLQDRTYKKFFMPVGPFLGLYDTGAIYDPFKNTDTEPRKRKAPRAADIPSRVKL